MKIFQGLFLRGGPHYLCGKREEGAIASHGHGKGGRHEVIHFDENNLDNDSSGRECNSVLDNNNVNELPLSELRPTQEVAWAEGEILRETRLANLRVRFLVKIA